MSVLDSIMDFSGFQTDGDFTHEEEDRTLKILKKLGEAIKEIAKENKLNISEIPAFSSSFLFVTKDAERTNFFFVRKTGMDSIKFRHFGYIINVGKCCKDLNESAGEVEAVFTWPNSTTDTNTYARELAIGYIGTLVEKRFGNESVSNPELIETIKNFRKDFPDSPTAFIMMKFSDSKIHTEITKVIRKVLATHSITGLRSDDKEYSDDLFTNIKTYMYGCDFGISVIERIESNEFNPNVSLETGYMMGLNKNVCILKDKTLPSLQSDLVGKIYRPFDTQDIQNSVKSQLEKWLKDKGFIS